METNQTNENRRVCKHYLTNGSCAFGDRCKFSHNREGPSMSEREFEREKENPGVVVVVVDIINGYPVFGRYNGKVMGMGFPMQILQHNCNTENYVKMLSYIIGEGYEIKSLDIVNNGDKIMIHFLKDQNAPISENME
jgi:hypothetical protein